MKIAYQKLLLTSSNYVGFGFIHYFFSSLGQTFFISVFVIHFLQASSISSDTFSWVYASATIAGAFMLPFLGNVLDRVKLRYFSVANGLVLSAFCLLLSYSSNSVMLFVALLGMRLAGQGLMPLIGSTAIARDYGGSFVGYRACSHGIYTGRQHFLVLRASADGVCNGRYFTGGQSSVIARK